MSENIKKIQKATINKDVSKYNSSDGYIELEFGEIILAFNPQPYAGLRIEQIEFDKNGRKIVRKINMSHAQAKKLKKEIRIFYPRD